MNIKNLYQVLTMVENLFASKNGAGMDVDLQKKLTEFKGQATDMIRKNPLGSLAAAVATGFLVGKILKK